MTRFLLVRHGITDFNSAKRLAGYSDVELNTAGRQQIDLLRDRLAQENIDAVYSSDLKRTMVAAQVISSPHKLEIVTCPELREMNYGQAEGLTFAEIGLLYPELAKSIESVSLKLRFPGGESFAEFMERVNRFLDKVGGDETAKTILVVSHAGTLRLLMCRLLGIAPEHYWQFRIDNASLSTIETYPRGAVMSLFNDTSHLRERKEQA